MRSLWLGLWLLSIGCAQLAPLPPPAFRTACGMSVRFAPDYKPESNARLALGEDIALRALASKAGLDPVKLCAKMARYTLQVGWPNTLYGGFHTECGGALVALKAYSAEALTHELGHVENSCMGYQEKRTGTWGAVLDWLDPKPIDFHPKPRWTGIYAAITAAAEEEARAAASASGRKL